MSAAVRRELYEKLVGSVLMYRVETWNMKVGEQLVLVTEEIKLCNKAE